MKTTVDTESLRDLAAMANSVLVNINDAEDCIKKVQIQLDIQTCHTIKMQLAEITKETDALLKHICNVRDDLSSISDIYEETEEEITRDILNLGDTDSGIRLFMPVIEPIRIGIKEIPVKSIGPDTKNLIRLIDIENEEKFRSWHENDCFFIPERNLIIDDWMKTLIVEAYANERI